MDTLNLILSQLPVWGAALLTVIGGLTVIVSGIGAALPAGNHVGDWCRKAGADLQLFAGWLRKVLSGPNLPPPPAVVAAVAMVAMVAMPGCAVVKPIARTALDIASDVCADFYATHKGVSWEEAVTTFCRTEEQLHPFLDELLAAQRRAGAKAGGAQ